MNDELGYLNLLSKVLNEGSYREDRTGTGTYSLFGERLEYDLSNNTLPILTTKKVSYINIIKELLWFISGETSVKPLQAQGVKFWDANTSREFLDKQGLTHFEEGELGAGYGFQWRHFGADYELKDFGVEGVDQLKNAIQMLKRDPFSRRIIVSAWNPKDLDKVALPPCHIMYQFYVTEREGIKYLDCMMYQRSADMFLGVPYNITCYSLLTHMVANLVGMKARKFIHVMGDCHIYSNHIEQVKTQLKNTPMPFPKVSIVEGVDTIDDYKLEHFKIEGYNSAKPIKADMAV